MAACCGRWPAWGTVVALLAVGLAVGNLAARQPALIPLMWIQAVLPGLACAWVLFGGTGRAQDARRIAPVARAAGGIGTDRLPDDRRRNALDLHRPRVHAIGAGDAGPRCPGWWRCSTSSSCCRRSATRPDATFGLVAQIAALRLPFHRDADPAVRGAAGRDSGVLAPDPQQRTGGGARRGGLGLAVPVGAGAVRRAAGPAGDRSGQPRSRRPCWPGRRRWTTPTSAAAGARWR